MSSYQIKYKVVGVDRNTRKPVYEFYPDKKELQSFYKITRDYPPPGRRFFLTRETALGLLRKFSVLAVHHDQLESLDFFFRSRDQRSSWQAPIAGVYCLYRYPSLARAW